MAARPTRKSVIRAFLERERPARIGPAELAALRRELNAALGGQARTPDERLVDALQEMGADVAPELGGVPASLRAILHFSTLEAAEATLRELDRRRGAAREHDGSAPALHEADACRRAAVLVRRRAMAMARNPKTTAENRAVKQEVVLWFTLWLQTPDLFFDWLDLRKQSPDYRRAFGGEARSRGSR